MKKLITALLALGLIPVLTGCAEKCAFCDQKIQGEGYEFENQEFCDETCARDYIIEDLFDGPE